MTSEQPTVFVSCGQVTAEERQLGIDICILVSRLTSLTPYFAENQTSFEGVSRNILRALGNSVAFIGVMHHRGRVATPDGEIVRASVWIEQEIAIAAFMTEFLQKKLHVRLYAQRGINREGIRDKLLLNPIPFDTHEEVLADLTLELPKWGAADAGPLEIQLRYDVVRQEPKRHDYRLDVKLWNRGAEAVRDFCVDVEFPNAFLEQNTTSAMEVPGSRAHTHRVLRATERHHAGAVLYPGDCLRVMIVDYFVTHDLFLKEKAFDQTIRVTYSASGIRPRVVDKPIREFQRF